MFWKYLRWLSKHQDVEQAQEACFRHAPHAWSLKTKLHSSIYQLQSGGGVRLGWSRDLYSAFTCIWKFYCLKNYEVHKSTSSDCEIHISMTRTTYSFEWACSELLISILNSRYKRSEHPDSNQMGFGVEGDFTILLYFLSTLSPTQPSRRRQWRSAKWSRNVA